MYKKIVLFVLMVLLSLFVYARGKEIKMTWEWSKNDNSLVKNPKLRIFNPKENVCLGTNIIYGVCYGEVLVWQGEYMHADRPD